MIFINFNNFDIQFDYLTFWSNYLLDPTDYMNDSWSNLVQPLDRSRFKNTEI